MLCMLRKYEFFHNTQKSQELVFQGQKYREKNQVAVEAPEGKRKPGHRRGSPEDSQQEAATGLWGLASPKISRWTGQGGDAAQPGWRSRWSLKTQQPGRSQPLGMAGSRHPHAMFQFDSKARKKDATPD